MPPVFDATKCKKCRKCVTRCPGYLLEMGEKKTGSAFSERMLALRLLPYRLRTRSNQL